MSNEFINTLNYFNSPNETISLTEEEEAYEDEVYGNDTIRVSSSSEEESESESEDEEVDLHDMEEPRRRMGAFGQKGDRSRLVTVSRLVEGNWETRRWRGASSSGICRVRKGQNNGTSENVFGRAFSPCGTGKGGCKE